MADVDTNTGTTAASAEPSVVIENDASTAVETGSAAAAKDSGGVEAVESEARNAGWVPKEEWKGDPARWRDAATYVDARNHVLPVVQKENKALRSEMAQMRAELAELRRIESERAQQREQLTVETLKLERRQALENQDYDRLTELDDKLMKAGVQEALIKAQPKQQAIDPAVQELWNDFASENEWLKNDEAKEVFIEKMWNLNAMNKQLVGRPLLDKAKDRVRREFPELFPGSTPRRGMAESGGFNGASRGQTRTWNDLKPEVRGPLEQWIEDTPGMTKAGVLKHCAADPKTYFQR